MPSGAASPRVAQVKGTAVVASLRFLRERFSSAALARVLEELPAPDRATLEGTVLVSSWYPMPLLLRLMEEAERQLGKEQPELARHMGRASAEYGLTGVYRVFFKMGSPEFILSRATRIFSNYYDTGEVVTVESARGRAAFRLERFAGGPLFCARVLGWMERNLALAGARDVHVAHSSCIHAGGAVCLFEGTWSS